MAKKHSKSSKTPSTNLAAQKSQTAEVDSAKWWREAIESIVVAIVLAFLFRTFEAEAFVIPTGSMAPTLQGRHKDVNCTQCGYRYRAGASLDAEMHVRKGPVIDTTCPMCHYTMHLHEGGKIRPNQKSFTGDRILVNKFAYQFGDPERWDVIVFKYPGNAKQNYIKRLVGLPGETIRIRHGDVWVRKPDSEVFEIARKSPDKLAGLLQLVHDSKYVPEKLVETGWPSRWQAYSQEDGGQHFITKDGGRTFELADADEKDQWIRYHHIKPSERDWLRISSGESVDFSRREGGLITDFYAYNAYRHQLEGDISARQTGLHWVGDLAIEVDVDLTSSEGEFLMLLVEGGRRYQCRIDVATGEATLTIDEGAEAFVSQDGQTVRSLAADTDVRGRGKYRLRFANVDDQLLLWVDKQVVQFDRDPVFESSNVQRPFWSLEDPGDLAPLGIGSRGLDINVSRLKVFRDIYYVATTGHGAHFWNDTRDYVDRSARAAPDKIHSVFSDPTQWKETPLFDSRGTVDFQLQEDQFFPLGDNSPQSKDGRLWESEPYVERELLTGRAFLIYWPHPWNLGIPGTNKSLPVLPNIPRMGLIR